MARKRFSSLTNGLTIVTEPEGESPALPSIRSDSSRSPGLKSRSMFLSPTDDDTTASISPKVSVGSSRSTSVQGVATPRSPGTRGSIWNRPQPGGDPASPAEGRSAKKASTSGAGEVTVKRSRASDFKMRGSMRTTGSIVESSARSARKRSSTTSASSEACAAAAAARRRDSSKSSTGEPSGSMLPLLPQPSGFGISENEVQSLEPSADVVAGGLGSANEVLNFLDQEESDNAKKYASTIRRRYTSDDLDKDFKEIIDCWQVDAGGPGRRAMTKSVNQGVVDDLGISIQGRPTMGRRNSASSRASGGGGGSQKGSFSGGGEGGEQSQAFGGSYMSLIEGEMGPTSSEPSIAKTPRQLARVHPPMYSGKRRPAFESEVDDDDHDDDGEDMMDSVQSEPPLRLAPKSSRGAHFAGLGISGVEEEAEDEADEAASPLSPRKPDLLNSVRNRINAMRHRGLVGRDPA